jgi:hypothetical protein
MHPQISQIDADSREEQMHVMIGQLVNLGGARLGLKRFVFSNLRKSA